MVKHAVVYPARPVDGGRTEEPQDRVRVLAAMVRRLTGALRDADLNRKITATTDPQATLADRYRLPLSVPRTARAEVTLNLKVAEEHIRAALAAVGVQWIAEA